MFRIAICDDNILDLNLLREGTEQWIKNTIGTSGEIAIFRESEKLKEILLDSKNDFDLYILDIMMSDPSGIQLGQMIRRRNIDVPIIYVTLSTEFALDAYANRAIRYLVKPFAMEELYSALDMAYALFRARPNHILVIRGSDSITSIVMEEIMYIENNLREITYTLNNGHRVFSTRRGGSFESSVGSIASDNNFVQPHKSFFINMRFIKALQSDMVIMDDGKEIPIVRRRLPDIQEKYMKFISEIWREGSK